MKKRKRICSLFLACMITVGSWIPGGAVTAFAEEPVSQKEAAENTVSDEGDFEKEYIQMHLEYIDSEEYIGEVSAVKGGLSQCLARTYEEAKLNEVNNSWDMASAVIDYLAKSEVDPSLLNTVTMTNEYDLLVTELMMKSLQEEGFRKTCVEVYLHGIETLFHTVKKVAEADKTVLEWGISVDDFLKDVETVSKTGKGIEALDSRLIDFRGKINDFFAGSDMDWFDDYMDTIGFVGDLSEMASSMNKSTFDAAILYATAVQMQEEWIYTWENIALSAHNAGTKESEKISNSIFGILNQIEGAKNDMLYQIMEAAQDTAEKSMLSFAAKSFGSEFTEKLIDSYPFGRLYRGAAAMGVTAGNFVTNMNDISAYGRMMYDYGNMSVHFWDGLKQAEQDLRTKQDYSSAVAFDAAFHLYKQLQLLTYDSAINYCQAIAEAPAGYILKYSVDDEIAGAVQMLSEKADWLEYECHEFPAEVINNGNNVVQNDDKIWLLSHSNLYVLDKNTGEKKEIELALDYRENLNQNRLWIYNDTVYLSVQDYNPNLVYKMFRITDDKPDYYVEQTAYAEIINLDAERGLLYYIEEPENLDINSGGYLRQKNLETGEVTDINTFYDGFSYTCESAIDPETGAVYLNYPNGNGAFGDIALNKWDGSVYSMDGSLYMMNHLLGIASHKLYVETFADQQEDWAVSSGAFVGNLYEKDLDNESGDFQLVMDETITLTNCRVEDGVLLYFLNDTAVPGGVPLSTYDTAFVNDMQDVFSIDFSVMSDEANSEIFCYRHDKETGEAVQIAAIPMEQENYAPFIMTGANWQEVDGYLYGPVAIYDKGMLNAGGVKPLEYRVYRVNEEDGSWEIIA